MKPDLPIVQLCVIKHPKTLRYEITTFNANTVDDRFIDLDSSQAMMKLEDLVPRLVPNANGL